MRTTTIVTGVLLFLLGPIFFALGGEHKSPTAFIPSIFGLALIVCGALATTTKSTKIAMHIAVVVAFLGVLGSMRFVSKWPGLLSSGDLSTKLGPLSGLLLFLLCGFFVVRSVLWFLGNRAARPIA
ncbi:hypothetical protein IAD21_01241 [Abditibacteriota bacterium]|nr:hypothetical protein IAD21_01241 [Abditibacteriota bacterium]